MKKLLVALVATFAIGSLSFANETAPADEMTTQGMTESAPEATTETKTEEGMKSAKKGKKKKAKKKAAKAEESTM